MNGTVSFWACEQTKQAERTYKDLHDARRISVDNRSDCKGVSSIAITGCGKQEKNRESTGSLMDADQHDGR
jgi:hypothetical protein